MSLRPGSRLEYGRTWPALEEFRELARDRRVIPVVRRLLADAETPVGVYRKLANNAPGTFLLESAEHGGVWSRYSIIGAASRAVLTESGGAAVWLGDPPVGIPTDGNPVEVLRDAVATLATEPIEGLPPLTGGMVGYIGYDAVRRWEKVPQTVPDDLRLPELAMMLATDVAVLDHSDGSLLLVANAVNFDDTHERVDDAWADAVDRLDRMTTELAEPADSTVAVLEPVDVPDLMEFDVVELDPIVSLDPPQAVRTRLEVSAMPSAAVRSGVFIGVSPLEWCERSISTLTRR